MTDVNISKRVFTLAVVAMTILWTMAAGLAPLMTNAQVSLSAGDLIKGESFSTVYYYGSDGMRYTFPNEKTYFTWYSDFDGVTTVSDSQLAGITLGGNNVYRPGTNWIKIQSDPSVYAVSPDGTLHWIETEAVAEALYGGSGWGAFVHDVPDTFFADYNDGVSLMSADSLFDGALVSDGSDTFLMWDGELRAVSSAGMSANRLQSAHVMSTSVDLSALTAGSDLSGVSGEISDTAQMVEGDAALPSGGLSISVASSTPAGVTMPGGANGVEMTKWALTASGADAQLDSLLVTLGGIGATTNFANAYLYEGTVRLTEGRSVNSATRAATFSNLNFDVAEGQTRYLSLVVSTASGLSAGGETASFGIASADDAEAGGAVSLSGSSYGNVFTFSASNAGDIEIDKNGSIADPSLGENDAVVGQFNITASTEDAELQRMRLNIDDAADHSDFKLWQGSTQIASGVYATGDSVDFVLDTPYTIAEGSNRIFKVTLDVGGQAAETIKVSVKSTADVIAVGGDFGFNMRVDFNTSGTDTGSYDGVTCASSAGDCSFSTIQGGDVTFTFDGPATADVSVDSSDVTFLAFTLTAAQDVTVKDLPIIVAGDADDLGDITFGASDDDGGTDAEGLINAAEDEANLQDISIRIAETGSRLMGPLELTVSGDDGEQTLALTDDFFMPGGTTYNLIVTADVDNGVSAGDIFAMALDISGVVIEDTNNTTLTNATDIVPTGDINGNLFTAASPSLTMALASSPTSFTTIHGSSGENMLGLTLTAGSAEDVTITDFLLDAWGDAASATSGNWGSGGEANAWVADFISSCSLYDGDGVLVGGPVGATDTGADFNFTSMNFVVPAGEVVLVDVMCNLHNPSTTTDRYFAFNVVAAANVTAQDESGDAVTMTGFNPNLVTTLVNPTVAVTIDDEGTLTIAGDSSSAEAMILLAGTSDNVVSTFRATATLEDFTVTTLTFDELQATADGQAAGAYANNIGSITLDYTDSTGEAASKTAYMSSNRSTMSGLDMFIDKDNVEKFSVSVDVPVIDRTSGGSATSGEKISIGFSDGGTLSGASDEFRAVGSGSGNVLDESDVSDNSSNINTHVVRETMPTINLHASSPSGAKTPGLQEALRFTIAASAGEDVIVDELMFAMSSTDNAPTTWNQCDATADGTTVTQTALEMDETDFTLYKTSNLSDPLEDADGDWNLWNATSGAFAACDTTDEEVKFVHLEGIADNANMVISAGTTETFSLYFDSTGASSSGDDQVRFDIPSDPILSLYADSANNFDTAGTAIVTIGQHDETNTLVDQGDIVCVSADTTCDAGEELMLVTSQDTGTGDTYNVYRGYLGEDQDAIIGTENVLYLPSSFVWYDDGNDSPSTTVFDDAVSGAYLIDNLPITGGTIVF
ncbi:hypothetical protein HOI83_02730 [Candidatus Uhrbacteria bacterium]|jgi:hypothetical protein|nr:hypothetical protein [Candidatus Uhrbacteria bacterium]